MEQSTLQRSTPSAFCNFLHTHRPLIIFIIGTMLLMVFLYSTIHALLDRIGAVEKMRQQVFPRHLAEYLTGINILLQASASVLLIIGIFVLKFLPIGLFVSGGIFTIYTAYTGMVLLNVFHRIPCTCINLFNMTWTQSLYFNTGVLTLAVLAYILSRRIADKPV